MLLMLHQKQFGKCNTRRMRSGWWVHTISQQHLRSISIKSLFSAKNSLAKTYLFCIHLNSKVVEHNTNNVGRNCNNAKWHFELYKAFEMCTERNGERLRKSQILRTMVIPIFYPFGICSLLTLFWRRVLFPSHSKISGNCDINCSLHFTFPL